MAFSCGLENSGEAQTVPKIATGVKRKQCEANETRDCDFLTAKIITPPEAGGDSTDC
jgi:hypothetical protein